jgi:hypothetical protein
MAYGLKQISPLDLRPSTGIGVKIPFSAKTAFQSVYTTKEQTKYNLINFLLTDRRERPFNPTFGAGLRSRLFQQISSMTMEDLKQSIISQVEANFQNVKVSQIEVLGDPGRNSIKIKFSYALINTSETDAVSIQIQNV